MNCHACDALMDRGFLYVRGIGGSLFWSTRNDVSFFSRKGLEQVDLNRVSVTPTNAQAVLEAWRCPACRTVAFKSS